MVSMLEKILNNIKIGIIISEAAFSLYECTSMQFEYPIFQYSPKSSAPQCDEFNIYDRDEYCDRNFFYLPVISKFK